MKYKQIIINDETGELLGESYLTDSDRLNSPKAKLCKKIVDDMLKKSNSIDDFDANMLYAWCKLTKEINELGQIKLLGGYMDLEINKKMLEDITLTGYTLRVIDKAHNFSCILMKNRKTAIRNWGELFEEIGCTNRKTQVKVKTFLISNKILRDMKVVNMRGVQERKFILNPFLFRGASYSSQLAVMLFQDFIKEGININCYPLRWLQKMGYVNEGYIFDNEE